MHCEVCGVRADRSLRCPSCRATVASVWILAMAGLAWAASLVIFLVLSEVVFVYVGDQYARLGAALPFSVRVYVALGRWAFPVAAPLSMTAPIILAVAGRSNPGRFLTWTRRYALSAILGVAWALMGVYQCHVAVTSDLSRLGVG